MKKSILLFMLLLGFSQAISQDATAGGFLLLDVDAPCTVYIDGVNKGTMQAESKRFKVDNDGDHLVVCISLKNPSVKESKYIEIYNGIQKLVMIELASIIAKTEQGDARSVQIQTLNEKLFNSLEEYSGTFRANTSRYYAGLKWSQITELTVYFEKVLPSRLEIHNPSIVTWYREDYFETITLNRRSPDFHELLLGNMFTVGNVSARHGDHHNNELVEKHISPIFKQIIVGVYNGQLRLVFYDETDLLPGETLRELFKRYQRHSLRVLEGGAGLRIKDFKYFPRIGAKVTAHILNEASWKASQSGFYFNLDGKLVDGRRRDIYEGDDLIVFTSKDSTVYFLPNYRSTIDDGIWHKAIPFTRFGFDDFIWRKTSKSFFFYHQGNNVIKTSGDVSVIIEGNDALVYNKLNSTIYRFPNFKLKEVRDWHKAAIDDRFGFNDPIWRGDGKSKEKVYFFLTKHGKKITPTRTEFEGNDLLVYTTDKVYILKDYKVLNDAIFRKAAVRKL